MNLSSRWLARSKKKKKNQAGNFLHLLNIYPLKEGCNIVWSKASTADVSEILPLAFVCLKVLLLTFAVNTAYKCRLKRWGRQQRPICSCKTWSIYLGSESGIDLGPGWLCINDIFYSWQTRKIFIHHPNKEKRFGNETRLTLVHLNELIYYECLSFHDKQYHIYPLYVNSYRGGRQTTQNNLLMLFPLKLHIHFLAKSQGWPRTAFF